ncbi:uncharacterized protein [Dysidea avara]|uniref:uncharacterized protein n=1 Tax=Dysidea avara TaxID=196820 RepID=UPI00331CA562
MSLSKCFPVTRLIDYNNFNYYYAYGNTLPEDFLQSVTTDVSEPAILSLGCGDIRSCFYTLWNNFDQRHSRSFKGIHFVLNDNSAAVLARNIIFLYLCTKIPRDKDDVMNWVASFWSIWYCLELLPQHKQVLVDALSQLLQWSKSIKLWSEQVDNPLRTLVRFTTPTSLSKIRHLWHMWYSDTRPVEQVRSARVKFLKDTRADEHHDLTQTHLVQLYGTYLSNKLSELDIKPIKDELDDHYQHGSVFAEKVLGLPVNPSREINSTFFEHPDGVYTLHCNAFPYRCFFHTFKYSPKEMKRLGYTGLPLMVQDSMFTQHSLLANCVQQFSIWVRSCAEILSTSQNILFTFDCSDALEFCHGVQSNSIALSDSLPSLFDAIYASNLIDYIAPPSFVIVAMSILKQKGLLFTDTFRHTFVMYTSKYIESVFGFDESYLPLICGIRCIDHDSEYSSQVSVKPVPCFAELDVLHSVMRKSFIWQHVDIMLLKQITEKDYTAILHLLCSSIKHILTCCIQVTRGLMVESLLCTETVVLLLQSFVSCLDSQEYNYTSCKFWVPLCSLLLGQKCLKPFIMSLQTQALLHGLHLHLNLSDSSCPVCNQRPISDLISQCSITVQQHIDTDEPRVVALIHNVSPIDSLVMKAWEAGSSEDFHVIDTIARRENDGSKPMITLDFFAPTYLKKEKYNLTIVFTSIAVNRSVVMVHKRLADCEFTDVCYSFYKCIMPLPKAGDSLLGTLLQHSGNVGNFESVISLSDQAMSVLECSHLATEQPTNKTVRIKIKDLHTDIFYPYPVDYNKVSIKFSRKSKKITVLAHRKCHQVYEEEAVYIVNPANILSLPEMPISKKDLVTYSALQYSEVERGISKNKPPEVNVKITLATLLQKSDERHFFQLVYAGQPITMDHLYHKCQCFLMVEGLKFDLQNKTPVIDMHFCFLTPEKCEAMYTQWVAVYSSEMSEMKHFTIDAMERDLLHKIFTYFAQRTVPTSKQPSKIYQLLVKKKIDHFFTRAVVYPLYTNINKVGILPPDRLLSTMLNASSANKSTASKPSAPENKCNYCGKCSENLKKCSRCRAVQYCNQDCQKKHWTIHKFACHS